MLSLHEKRLLQEHRETGNIINPDQKYNTDPDRIDYINHLFENFDYRHARTNVKALNKELKNKIKQTITKQEIIGCMFIGAILGGGTGAVCLPSSLTTDKTITQVIKKPSAEDLKALTIFFLCMLLGMGAGVGFLYSVENINVTSHQNDFYRRIAYKYFKRLQFAYPQLSSSVLYNLNPELLDVAITLLISNLPKEAIQKLQNISTNLWTKTYTSDIAAARDYKVNIDAAIAIVDKYVNINVQLFEELLKTYKGNIPKTFVLNMNQKTK